MVKKASPGGGVIPLLIQAQVFQVIFFAFRVVFY